MRWVSTTVLAVLLVGLGTFYYVYEIRQAPEREKAATIKDRLWKELEGKDVDEIVVRKGGAEALHLKKNGDAWSLVAPVSATADRGAADGLATSLATLRVEREIEANPQKPADFGLAPPAAEVTENLDAVLVSHLHHDHADLGSLRKLGRETRMLVPPGSRGFFAHHGFLAADELTPGESASVGNLTVTAVEADHDGGRRRHARRSQAIGFLVRGSRSVYFAGDTDIFPGMKGLAGELGFALLPIWGWGPTVGPGHLDPEGAAEAAALLSPRVAVPIHWGTLYPFGLHHLRPDRLWHPGKEFLDCMREVAPQVETRVLSPGEATSLA